MAQHFMPGDGPPRGTENVLLINENSQRAGFPAVDCGQSNSFFPYSQPDELAAIEGSSNFASSRCHCSNHLPLLDYREGG
jgi:hypothetical protein